MRQRKPWWVGVRASDAGGIEHLFEGGIAIVGVFPDKNFNAFSVEEEIGRRLDHNDFRNDKLIDELLISLIAQVVSQNPGAKFLFQDQLCFSQSLDFWRVSTCNNPPELLAPLKDKGIARSLFGRHVSTVGSTMMLVCELSYDGLVAKFPKARRFVVQAPASSGGHGSLLVDGEASLQVASDLGSSHVVVSEYRDNMVPMNSHMVVFWDQVVVLPPSTQLVSPDAQGRLLYTGCDYFQPSEMSLEVVNRIEAFCRKIGDLLRTAGYRGVVGLDYLADEHEVLFVEINPRFQASSAALNRGLLARGVPSLHQLHLQAFAGADAPDLPKDIRPALAQVQLLQGANLPDLPGGHQGYFSPDSRASRFSRDSLELKVEMELTAPEASIEQGATLGRVVVDRPLTFFHPTMGTLTNHALVRFGRRPPRLLPEAQSGNISALARLKFNLFSSGARLTPEALALLTRERKDLTIRDGIAGGLEVRLPHRMHVNIPIKEHFALVSAYAIDARANGSGYRLVDTNGDALDMEILPIPDFVQRSTSRGTPMVQVGQMFNERLSIEVFFGCVNNRVDGTACQFCELGAEDEQSFAEITDIRELVAYCEASPDIPMRHVLIGGGTPPEHRWSIYFEALEAVRAETACPVYMMVAPPNDVGRLKELHARGVAEIGMNVELYDRDLARRFMPAKGKLSLSRYFGAMDQAVALWGATGAVRSILIVGLEPLDSTLAGVEELCRRGVMPILSPYRPVPGTPLAHCPPPSADMMFEAWSRGQGIAERYGLTLGPSCVACQNNTIAMPFGSGYRYY